MKNRFNRCVRDKTTGRCTLQPHRPCEVDVYDAKVALTYPPKEEVFEALRAGYRRSLDSIFQGRELLFGAVEFLRSFPELKDRCEAVFKELDALTQESRHLAGRKVEAPLRELRRQQSRLRTAKVLSRRCFQGGREIKR